MAWSLKTFLGLSPATAAELNQIRTNLNDHLRQHAHTGAAGDGAVIAVAQDYIQILPYFPHSDVNWDTRTGLAFTAFGGYLATDNTNQNNSCSFYVAMRAGTWRLDVLARKASSYGIATVTLGGTTLGTMDFYASGTSLNTEHSLTGIVWAGTPVNGATALTFTMATKNASASAYGAGLQFMALRRTGA